MAGNENHPPLPTGPHVIIAGFGIPGRFIAELLDYHQIPYSVIEMNAAIVDRCTTVAIISGDSREEAILRRAGIENATMLAISFPAEDVVYQMVVVSRGIWSELRNKASVK